MPHTPRPSLVALALASICSPLWAQHDHPHTLETVVVSAQPDKDLPEASQLAGEVFQARKRSSADTAALLNGLPGVSTHGAGGVSSLPVIHGLADDRLRISVDGMDLISACANHMNPPLSYLDPTKVGSIQVFAGIAPVSAGGDSIGGSIIVTSAPPVFAAPGHGLLTKGEIGAFYRSNGDAWGANVSASAASEAFSVTYAGSTAEADNYRAARSFKNGAVSTGTLKNVWIAGDEVASTQYRSQNHHLGLAARHDNHLLELKLGVQHIPYQAFPNQRMDMTDNRSQQFNLRYLGRHAWGTLEGRLYEENTRHTMNFLAAKETSVAGMPMDTRGKTRGAKLKADIDLAERDILRIGAEYQRYRLDDWWDPVSATANGMMSPNTFWNINHGRRDHIDIFGEWEARWTPAWTTQLGLRHSTLKSNADPVQGYNFSNVTAGMMGMTTNYLAEANAFNALDRQRTDHHWDVTALARYTAAPTHSYEAGFARKTRSPNLYERYTWSTTSMSMQMINWAGDANGYVGNPDLQPEVANTFSASADLHDAGQEQWHLKATPYYTYIQDYIDARRCLAGVACASNGTSNNFVYLQFVNQSAEIYGADISGYYRLGHSALGNFSINGVMNYTRGRNKTTGDNLYNIMPLTTRLSLVHKTGRWTNTIETQLVAAKDDVSAVRNELKTAGYGLLNLRSSREWQQVRLDFGIENALNKFHTLPQGGAYVGQRPMTYGTGVPGMGRSAYLGVSLKF